MANAVNYKELRKGFTGEIMHAELIYDIGGGDTGVATETATLCKFIDAAIIIECTAQVSTAFTDAGGTGTLDIGVSGGDVDAFVDGAVVATLVDNYVVKTTAGQCVYMAANSTIESLVSTEDLTAGKVHLFIDYINAR